MQATDSEEQSLLESSFLVAKVFGSLFLAVLLLVLVRCYLHKRKQLHTQKVIENTLKLKADSKLELSVLQRKKQILAKLWGAPSSSRSSGASAVKASSEWSLSPATRKLPRSPQTKYII